MSIWVSIPQLDYIDQCEKNYEKFAEKFLV